MSVGYARPRTSNPHSNSNSSITGLAGSGVLIRISAIAWYASRSFFCCATTRSIFSLCSLTTLGQDNQLLPLSHCS
jgi:hypothetical protein